MKYKKIFTIGVITIALILLGIGLFIGGGTKEVTAIDSTSLPIITENVKTYNESTETATITDKDENILVNIKLLTPIKNEVGVGYVRVAEKEFETFNDYETFEELMSKIELYDKNDNMKPITRQIDYKYLFIENYMVDDYTCSEEIAKNGTNYTSCEVIGQHQESRDIWIPLDKRAFYTKGKLVIGLYTTTVQGENIEWIPTIENIRVEEWAEWTADLNTDLESYYKFDEQDTTGSGTIIDSLGNINGTNVGASNKTGKIGTAYDYVTNDWMNMTSNPLRFIGSGDFTVNCWIKPESTSRMSYMALGQDASPPESFINFYTESGNLKTYLVTPTDTANPIGGTISTGSYNMATVRKIGTNITTFLAASQVATDTLTGTFDSALLEFGAVFYMGRESNAAPWERFFDGDIDECSLHSRGLNTSEITQLYNSGDGITFTDDFDTCTYPGSGDWNISMSDSCILNTDTDIGVNDIIFYGVGNATVNATINVTDYNFQEATTNSRVDIESNGRLNIG